MSHDKNAGMEMGALGSFGCPMGFPVTPSQAHASLSRHSQLSWDLSVSERSKYSKFWRSANHSLWLLAWH